VLLLGMLLAALAPAPPAAAQTSPPGAPATAVRGVLRADGEPVPDVGIEVSRDGERIDAVRTDDGGAWEVVVPGPGTYEVALDTGTLPEGITLRDPERATSEVAVREGQRAGVIFALVSGGGGGRGQPLLDRAATLTVEGVKFGTVIAMAAVGLSLIFGVTGLVNFAHGELVTFGALVAWWLSSWGPGPELPLVAAGALAVVAGGVFGAGLERGLFAPLRRRQAGNIALIVVTIGLSILLRHVFLTFFGGATVPFRQYAVQRVVAIGPVALPPKDWVIVVASLVVLVVVGLLLQRTQLGTAMRAVADDRDLAEASGIDVRRIILATWIGGAALAALGGVFQGLTERVSTDMGFTLLLSIFAAVVVGGLGTAYGAMVGGLLIGLVVQLSTLWVSVEFKVVVALAVLIVVLLVRPQGILGQAERVG
jgi:branched-chain amino acid transport system permease protein